MSAALAWLSGERGVKPAETTLGVVGVGNVGSLVADYAASWGFRVMRSDPPRERAEGLGATEGFYPLKTLVAACARDLGLAPEPPPAPSAAPAGRRDDDVLAELARELAAAAP